MSLRITSSSGASLGIGGNSVKTVTVNRENKARDAVDKKPTASTRESSSTVKTQDRLRFELSTLSKESVSAQENISFHQVALNGLDTIERNLENLQEKPTGKDAQLAIRNLRDAVENTRFEGKEVLKNDQEEDDSIQAVVISRPPKAGTYAVKIVSGEADQNNLSFSIKVTDQDNLEKVITTSVSPATGAIEGIELYFETDPVAITAGRVKDQETTLVVREDDSDRFPIPSFKREVSRLESSTNPDAIQRTAKEALRKVETTRKGLEETYSEVSSKFQNLETTKENLNAARTETNSLSGALNALNTVKDQLSQELPTVKDLYTGENLSNSKNLLD